MRPGLAAILLSGVVAAGASQGEVPSLSRWVAASDPSFQCLGVWRDENQGRYAIHPGSQIRFVLKGKARLSLDSGLPDSVRVAVRKDGETLVVCPAGPEGVDLNGGDSEAMFSVVYLASSHNGFDPSLPEAVGAELHFRGVQLGEGGEVRAPPEIRDGIRVDFLGDSITAGAFIRGPSTEGLLNSDVRLSYAFLLAEKWGVSYRIRASGGENLDEIAAKVLFFRKGMALPAGKNPDIVFINIGANDRSKEDAPYRSKMEALLDAVFTFSPEARVVLLNFHRMTPNRWPVLKSLARSYSNGAVYCFDARPCLVGYSDGGVHPDAESHRLLAEALDLFVRHNGLLKPWAAGEADPDEPAMPVSP